MPINTLDVIAGTKVIIEQGSGYGWYPSMGIFIGKIVTIKYSRIKQYNNHVFFTEVNENTCEWNLDWLTLHQPSIQAAAANVIGTTGGALILSPGINTSGIKPGITEDEAQPGVKVILGEHEQIDLDDPYSKDWNSNMDQYVGKIATLYHRDITSFGFVRFTVGEFPYAWRIANMTLADEPLVKVATPVSYGATCIQCNSYNEYVESTSDYVCAICKAWKKAWE